jgi:hypothetical protein
MQRGGDPKCPQGRANGRGNSGPGRGVVAERSHRRGGTQFKDERASFRAAAERAGTRQTESPRRQR